MKIVKFDIDDPRVEAFSGRQAHTLFQEPLWSQVIHDGLGYPVCYYGLVDSQDNICLVLPGLVMDLVLLKLFYAHIPYGGFVGPAEHIPEFLELMPAVFKRDGLHEVRIARCHYDRFDHLEGFRRTLAYQHVLHFNARTVDEVWMGFKRRVRRDVRKAQNRWGVTVRDVVVGDVPRIDELYADTIGRNNTFRVWTPKFLELVLERYVKAGNGDMIVAEAEGQIIACLVVLYADEVCHGLMGVSDRNHLVKRPNDLLMWTAMERSIKRGLKEFDFMTSIADDEHLVEFKDKWGTTAYDFWFYEADLNPVRARLWRTALRLSRTTIGSRLLRKFWRK